MSADYEYRRRMENWRRWRISACRSLGGSPYPVYNLAPRPPRGENIMPLLAGEAEETDQAAPALPAGQKRKMLGCRRERVLELLDEARTKILGALGTRGSALQRREG